MLVLFISSAWSATLTVASSGGDYGSIQDAVDASRGGDEIHIAAETWVECVDLGGKDLSLVGAGAGATRLDPGGGCDTALVAEAGETASLADLSVSNAGKRCLSLAGGATLHLDGVTVEGCGSASADGGGAYVDASAIVATGGTFQDNEAQDGGHIYATEGSTVTLTDTTLSGGNASSDGGGLYAAGGGAVPEGETYTYVGVLVTLHDVLFEGNSAGAQGGALYLGRYDGLSSESGIWNANQAGDGGGAVYTALTAQTYASVGETFSANTAGYGGALYFATRHGNLSAASHFTLQGATVTSNRSSVYGGAIYSLALLDIRDSAFSENSAGGGGAIAFCLSLDVSNTSFDQNSATSGSTDGEGGAIRTGEACDGDLTLTDVALRSNQSAGAGGALYGGDLSDVTWSLLRASFTGNDSSDNKGGAVCTQGDAGYPATPCTLRIVDSQFQSNTAKANGGALQSSVDTLEITGTTFGDNMSLRGKGGAIYATEGEALTLTASTFTDNSSGASAGGALYADLGYATLSNLRATGNSAATDGGAFYLGDSIEVQLDALTLLNNRAAGAGGGLYLEPHRSHRSRLAMRNSTICGNQAATGGGLMLASEPPESWEIYAHTVALTNSRIVENAAVETGGGLHIAYVTGLDIANNDLLGNTAATGGTVYAVSSAGAFLNNVVAWTGTGDGAVAADSETDSETSFQSNDWWSNTSLDVSGAFTASTRANGNLMVDPGFVRYSQNGDCEDDDLSLASDSALVDAGSPDILDADGSPSDIGATGGPGTPAAEQPADTAGPLDSAEPGDADDTGPSVIYDTAPLDSVVPDFADAETGASKAGGGCAGSGSRGLSPFALGVLLVLRRRKRVARTRV